MNFDSLYWLPIMPAFIAGFTITAIRALPHISTVEDVTVVAMIIFFDFIAIGALISKVKRLWL